MSFDESSSSLYGINTCSSSLKNFYTTRGRFYEMNYSKFDLETMKNLAKLIIGHCSISQKSSTELFGDSIRILYTEMGIEMLDNYGASSTKREKTEKTVKKVTVLSDQNSEGKYISLRLFCTLNLTLLVNILFRHS